MLVTVVIKELTAYRTQRIVISHLAYDVSELFTM